jgi:hypothetical protein
LFFARIQEQEQWLEAQGSTHKVRVATLDYQLPWVEQKYWTSALASSSSLGTAI